MFTQLMNTSRWFALGFGFWLLVWATFIFDMRFIHRLQRENRGVEFLRLMAVTEREQMLNIKLFLPVTVVFYAASWWLVARGFIGGDAHIYLAAIQLVALIGYQMYSLVFYRKIVPLILSAQRERDRSG